MWCALKTMTTSSEYEMNWTGPNMEPCGTLHATGMAADSAVDCSDLRLADQTE